MASDRAPQHSKSQRTGSLFEPSIWFKDRIRKLEISIRELQHEADRLRQLSPSFSCLLNNDLEAFMAKAKLCWKPKPEHRTPVKKAAKISAMKTKSFIRMLTFR